MSSFTVAFGIAFIVFTSYGALEMLGAGKQIAMGISQGNLSEEDAMKFMNKGIDVTENASSDPEEKKKAALMRRMMVVMKSKESQTSLSCKLPRNNSSLFHHPSQLVDDLGACFHPLFLNNS